MEELRKTGSRSVGSVADLALELQRSQARAVVLVRDRLELGSPSRASTPAPPTSLGRSLSIAPWQALRNTVESQLKNTQVTHTYGSWAQWNAEHEKLVALTRQGLTAREARARLRPDDPAPSSKAIKAPSRPINGLGRPPDEMTFTEEATGRTWTVLEWFAEKEGVKLRHPQLPCLLFGKDGRNAVPMEL